MRGSEFRQNRHMPSSKSRFWNWAPVAAILLGVAVVIFAYWPGIMIDDTRWQYQQSVDDSYEDWHPPLMAWIWRRLMFVHPGPAPMFVLQVALYWAGIGLAAYWAHRSGRRNLALAIALAGWLPAPFALTGTVTKDCLMAGALLSATGLLLLRSILATRLWKILATFASTTLVFFAAALRLNAVIACLPIFLAALPECLISTKLRFSAAAVAGAIALVAIGPAIDRLLQAEQTDVDLSLIIFDLGGITEHSRVSQFPPDLHVRDPVAVNHRCYDPVEWDSYSSWAKTRCPLGFEPFQNAKDEDDFSPLEIWLNAILRHPLAYAQHRLSHFNLSTAFLVPRGPLFTAWSQSVPNPWGYAVRPNALLTALTRVADADAHIPLGWPIFWISLGLAAIFAAVLLSAQPLVTAIAVSSAFYGLSYLVFGVAVGMRYYLWTISGAALAAVLVGGELLQRRTWSARSMTIPASIVAVPTMLAVLARVLL